MTIVFETESEIIIISIHDTANTKSVPARIQLPWEISAGHRLLPIHSNGSQGMRVELYHGSFITNSEGTSQCISENAETIEEEPDMKREIRLVSESTG